MTLQFVLFLCITKLFSAHLIETADNQSSHISIFSDERMQAPIQTFTIAGSPLRESMFPGTAAFTGSPSNGTNLFYINTGEQRDGQEWRHALPAATITNASNPSSPATTMPHSPQTAQPTTRQSFQCDSRGNTPFNSHAYGRNQLPLSTFPDDAPSSSLKRRYLTCNNCMFALTISLSATTLGLVVHNTMHMKESCSR